MFFHKKYCLICLIKINLETSGILMQITQKVMQVDKFLIKLMPLFKNKTKLNGIGILQ